MPSVAVHVDASRTLAFLSTLSVAIDGEGVKQVAGRAGVRTVQDHLRGLDKSRANALGGRRTHFYAAAAMSTNYRTVSDGALISIPHQGFAQRYHGGTIKPVNTKYLTIPARPEAHGHAASDFNDLEPLIRYRDGAPRAIALVDRQRSNTSTRETTGGDIYFWLVKSVTQAADSTVLPSEDTIAADALQAISSYVDRQIARASK